MGTSNAERQAAWRARRQQRLKVLEREVQKLRRENAKLQDRLRNGESDRASQQPTGEGKALRQLAERVGALEAALQDIAERDTPGSEWHRDRARRVLGQSSYGS